MRRKPGKLLGGEPPRRGGRWTGGGGRARKERPQSYSLLAMLALGMFVLGLVGGFAWSQDRQLRGGILRQEAESRQRPDRVRLRDLPPYVPAAFAAVTEPGLLRQGRLRSGDRGTTVARELARQVHLLPEGLSGEARELVMGPVLERRASSRERLEMYLNRVHLGGDESAYPIYGIWHASREYFDKAPSELTLSEAATLAGLLLPPRISTPRRRVGAVGARRNEVLEVMLRGGLISPEQYRAAVAEPLGFQPGLADPPMTRPLEWGDEEEVIRLPQEMRVPADSLNAPPREGEP